jgi:hypothetical protein
LPTPRADEPMHATSRYARAVGRVARSRASRKVLSRSRRKRWHKARRPEGGLDPNATGPRSEPATAEARRAGVLHAAGLRARVGRGSPSGDSIPSSCRVKRAGPPSGRTPWEPSRESLPGIPPGNPSGVRSGNPSGVRSTPAFS